MDLVAEVDARFLIGIEDRTPAAREFVERRLDQAPAAAAARDKGTARPARR